MEVSAELNRIVTLVDDKSSSLKFDVPEGGSLSLDMASFKTFKNALIEVNVGRNGSFSGAFADFSKGSGKLALKVHLRGEGSSCEWRLSSLCRNDDIKIFDTSVFHDVPNTQATMSNYGIAMDESKLVFTGVSEILKGSRKTKTRQVAKIIVFDPKCDGKCSPVLKIGENEVMASHAAVVGRLNEDHLFYLQSRGISLDNAKKLITLGYLNPILNYFADESVKAKISKSIEEGI